MRHYLNAADAFLFASKSETQGIVLLEAMAAGCPVAAVRASGAVDVGSGRSEEARKTAELYESGRIAALAADQYGLMTGQKEAAGYGEHGKGMFVPSILRLFKAA